MNATKDELTAVDIVERRDGRRWTIAFGVIAVLVVIAISFALQISRINKPVGYANDEMYFRYGSIGSDVVGVPYWVFRVMPEICPTDLPGGYASLGVIQEPGMPTPIGFSMRRIGPVDIVGPNCALCHTASVRATPTSDPMIVTTAPAHQLNLMGYFKFLFACGRSPDFTAGNVLSAISKYQSLGLFDRLTYRFVVMPQLRTALAEKGAKFDSIIAGRPDWGPGRVDTFNPYKVLVFNLDMKNDTSIGTARFMSIWNQAEQEGIWHHWDGNNDSLDERNLSAAIGAGVTLNPPSFDFAGIERIKQWLMNHPPPAYPFPIDLALAAQGKPIYQRMCASCHDPSGEHFGTVTPLASIGTDPERNLAFDKAMAARMNTIGAGYPWAFHRFRSTNGYANHALEGIWVRAPYLHNGSVPTLDDLLKPPEQRPVTFYAGDDVYDQAHVGFVSSEASSGDRKFLLFDTRLKGNSNTGHVYGTTLSDQDRRALLEYLKSL
ncbi:MAG TPA: cytochrome c [Acetobacteraceae bacterium]|nr:cytochrome c [Acetobacteraceae bacterium]